MTVPEGLEEAVDRSSPVPLYYQVAQRIEAEIQAGRFPPGTHLHNELTLAEELGVSRHDATQTTGARRADGREARLLELGGGAPVLTMRRTAYDDAGRPVEYGSHAYPAERYSFEMSLVTR